MEYLIAALLLVASFLLLTAGRSRPPVRERVLQVQCPRCERTIYLASRRPGLYTCRCQDCASAGRVPGGRFSAVVFSDGEAHALQPQEQ